METTITPTSLQPTRIDRWGKPRRYDAPGRPIAENRQNALGKWIKTAGKGRAEIAQALGISRSYLDMLCRGERTPRIDVAVRIKQMTGILEEYWVNPV